MAPEGPDQLCIITMAEESAPHHTHAEIFGEDDASDGDQEDHTSRTGTDGIHGKQRKILRARPTGRLQKKKRLRSYFILRKILL
jgi:hypothetical protein